MNVELELVRGTIKLLTKLGKTEEVYFTAENAPYSNQQRPDLIFIPIDQKNYVYFIEYKLCPMNGYTRIFIDNLIENKTIVESKIEVPLKYAFATNDEVSNEYITYLSSQDIIVFTLITDPNKLFDQIVNWYERRK